MWNTFIKINLIAAFLVCNFTDAQLFRTKDRMDNLEGFDGQKFSYGFYLAGNNYDYKLSRSNTTGLNSDLTHRLTDHFHNALIKDTWNNIIRC